MWNFDFLPTASSDNLARLWCVETGEIKREYSGHQKAVVCLAFNDSVLGWGRGETRRKAQNNGPFGECNRRYFMCWQIGSSFWKRNVHHVWTTHHSNIKSLSDWKDLILICYEACHQNSIFPSSLSARHIYCTENAHWNMIMISAHMFFDLQVAMLNKIQSFTEKAQ